MCGNHLPPQGIAQRKGVGEIVLGALPAPPAGAAAAGASTSGGWYAITADIMLLVVLSRTCMLRAHGAQTHHTGNLPGGARRRNASGSASTKIPAGVILEGLHNRSFRKHARLRFTYISDARIHYLDEFLVGGVCSIRDIIPDGSVKQDSVLVDNHNTRAQIIDVVLIDRLVVDEDLALQWVV